MLTSPMNRRLLLLGATLALTALPSFAGTQDPCEDDGYCHFTRWVDPAAGPGAHTGAAVAIEGNRALVGVPEEGRVLVYELFDGEWTHIDDIVSPDGLDTGFGTSIATRSGLALIGAPHANLAALDAGAAYFYAVSNPGVVVDTVVSMTPQTGGHFGEEVALSLSWAAVGEPGALAGGRCTTFERVGADWEPRHDLQLGGSEGFGTALEVWGSDLLVGDWTDDSVGLDAGAVYFYKLSTMAANGPLLILPDDPEAGGYFGYDLSASDSRLLIGAPGHDTAAVDGGAAYVFERKSVPSILGLDYEQVTKLTPCNQQTDSWFGARLSLHLGHAAIGAPGDTSAPGVGGKIYTYSRQDIFALESWVPKSQIFPADAAAGDFFGGAVAVHGTQIIAGAPLVDQGVDDVGAAYFVSTQPKTLGGGACPCDIVASAAPFGPAKAGSLGFPILEMSHPLIPGELSLLKLSNVPSGAQPVLFYGFQSGFVPFDEGTLFMTDPKIIFLPTVSAFGQVGASVTMPADPTFCGIKVYLQAMFVDAGASGPYQTAQTKGLRVQVGY